MVETQVLEERIKNMLEDNKKEHAIIMRKLDEVCEQIEALPTRFATRIEYDHVNNRVSSIESIIKWVGVMVVGAVIGAILKLVLL